MSDHVMEIVVIIEVFLDLHSGCECSNAMERMSVVYNPILH